METTTTNYMIPVTTVPVTKVDAGTVQITARTRETKEKKVDAANKSRSIVIKELQVACEKKYVSLVIDALYEAAKNQLADLWKEGDPKEVDSRLFVEDALLAYYARAAESKRLNGESIAEWYKTSSIREKMMEQGGQKVADAVLIRLQNLAAPEPRYTEEKALAAIASLAEDSSSEMGVALISKLQRIVEKLRAESVKAEEVSPF